jgi:hypothetical protein
MFLKLSETISTNTAVNEAPNPNSTELSSAKKTIREETGRPLPFELGAWSFFGTWNFEFGFLRRVHAPHGLRNDKRGIRESFVSALLLFLLPWLRDPLLLCSR